MRRRVIILGLIGILTGWAGSAQATAPDLGWSCGMLYGVVVKRLTNNGAYRFLWVDRTISKTEVTVILQVDRPEGVMRYSGFRCLIGGNGTLIPQPFSDRREGERR